MRRFAVYDVATGEIAYLGDSTRDAAWIAEHWPGAGQAVTMLDAPIDQRLHWVDAGTLRPREPIAASLDVATIAADGLAQAVLSGLPDPCVLEISGAVAWGPGEVTGGSVTITSTAPGTIMLRVTASARWLPWEGSVDAH